VEDNKPTEQFSLDFCHELDQS
jgi:hypothetical protein